MEKVINNLRNIYAYVKPEGYIPLQDEPFILNKATNRSDKRLIMKSVRHIHAKLAELENYFYNGLFFSDKDYKELYSECLEQYKEICEKYIFSHGLIMDDYYFVKLFKPLENETNSI